MWRIIVFVYFFLSLSSVSADTLERGNITSCAYQAGTAYEIQHIRQQEGHLWDEFEANIKQIYNDSQGRADLLIIAEQVFIHPADTSADAIHDEIFQGCIERQQGTEPLT